MNNKIKSVNVANYHIGGIGGGDRRKGKMKELERRRLNQEERNP